MSQVKYIEIVDSLFGEDTKDMKLSASGKQWVSVTITKQEALTLATKLQSAVLTWDDN